MNGKLILIVATALLSGSCAYAWTRAIKQSDGRTYPEWIRTSLDDLFIILGKKQISRALILLALFGAIIGFLLPGKVVQVDQRLTVDKAIRLNKQGKHAEAALLLDPLAPLPSPLVHNEIGVAYMGQNLFLKAEKEFQKAVTLLPRYGKAHQNLALLYALLGRHTEAAFEESRAIESENFLITDDQVYNFSDDLRDQTATRIFLSIVMAWLFYKLPKPVILFLKKRRRKLFDEQLSDGLVMIANGLRAGLSLVQAIEMVSREAKAPLSQEFELILRQQRLGSSLNDAFGNIVRRMPGKDTRIMVNATLILLESGGNLPERFDNLAQTIQQRKRILQKIKTMTAEGETQAWILSLLPPVLALVMNALNRDVFSLLYTTTLGWMIIVLMVLMEILGIFFMIKMVKVKL